MDKDFILSAIRQRLEELKEKRLAAMDGTMSYSTRAVTLSNIEKERCILGLVEELALVMPKNYELSLDSAKGLEKLCMKRPYDMSEKAIAMRNGRRSQHGKS